MKVKVANTPPLVSKNLHAKNLLLCELTIQNYCAKKIENILLQIIDRAHRIFSRKLWQSAECGWPQSFIVSCDNPTPINCFPCLPVVCP